MNIYGYENGKRVDVALGESVCAYIGTDGRARWASQGGGFGLYRVVAAELSRPIWDERGPAQTTLLAIDGKTERLVLVSEHGNSRPFANMDMTKTNRLGFHTDPRLTESA